MNRYMEQASTQAMGDSVLTFGAEARDQVLNGMKKVSSAVACTLGPRGRTVLIQQKTGTAPIVTKDGVTVSKSINLPMAQERLGADLIKEAASRTNDDAGDGTTTSTVLTYSMCKEVNDALKRQHNPVALVAGMTCGVEFVVEALRSMSRKVSTLEEAKMIATISANGDAALGELVANAVTSVGPHGIVSVEDAKSTQTTLLKLDGLRFERGYMSSYFVTNGDKMHAQYDDCRVLVTDTKLNALAQVLPILEAVAERGQSLIIIADDIEGEVLQTLALNKSKGALKVVAVKAPGYGESKIERLRDICALTGATLISATTGNSVTKASYDQLGRAKRVTVDAKTTTIIAMPDAETSQRVDEHTKMLLERSTDVTLTPEEAQELRSRTAALSGSVMIVKVGGVTELDVIEKKYRIEDAINATRAALLDGILAGGGLALLRCSFNLGRWLKKRRNEKNDGSDKSFNEGVSIICTACAAPVMMIATNAGKDAAHLVKELEQTKDRDVGYNAALETYTNMYEAGIIDPVKVTTLAVTNAASVAQTFALLGAIICEDKNERK